MIQYTRIRELLRRFVFTKYITPRKFLNLSIVFFQYLEGRPVVVGWPVGLVIDPCNICNLHCPLCPTGQGRKDRLKGKMSFATFKKIIDEVGPYLYRIDLHNWGEPLLNEELYDMIYYAHARNIEVRVNSNLNCLDKTRAAKLVQSGLDELIVSCDGTTQETYAAYRVGGSIAKVMKGIEMILQQKAEQKKSTPSITWQFLVMKQNEHEIPTARKIANDLQIHLSLVPIHADMGQELFQSVREKIEYARHWLPSDEEWSLYDTRNETQKWLPTGCQFLWFQMVINPNGSVSPCCSTYAEKYDFGNVTTAYLKDIWNNAHYQASRRIARRKMVEKTDPKNACYYCIRNSAMFKTKGVI